MGNTQSIKKINFEDMQLALNNSDNYLIINTLPENQQTCLISNTITIDKEELIMNKLMKENKTIKIIVYGKNCNDITVEKKYQQLLNIGFYNVFVYFGGLFEWLLLQDIYGKDLFPTTNKELDLLRFKPLSTLNLALLEY